MIILSFHIFVVYLIVDALLTRTSYPARTVLSRNCIVLMSLSLRTTIVSIFFSFFFFPPPPSLFFQYNLKEDISIQKFWVTRIVVTVDSSSFLLVDDHVRVMSASKRILFLPPPKKKVKNSIGESVSRGKEVVEDIVQ